MTKKVENPSKISPVKFTLSYDAKDNEYAHHRIDAEQLVDIVKNMQELITRTDHIIHKRKSTVKLYLQAPVQAGSLQVPFLLENLGDLSTALEILSYLGIGAVGAISKGVFDVLKETKGETILEVKTEKKSNEAKLILEGKELVLDKKVALLAANSKVRESIKQIVATPLEGKIQPKFKITLFDEMSNSENKLANEENLLSEVIAVDFKRTQVKIFETMAVSPTPEIQTEEKNVTIALTQISFTGSEKGWKMVYGNRNDVSVELLDTEFIKKVNNNIASFKKGDLFNVTLRITTRKINNRETIKYSILKVKNHMADSKRKIVSDRPIKKKNE